jgi:phosphoribosylaminoimidazole (AIR) synthetase
VDEVMTLLPPESKTVRLVRRFMPHLLDDLNDIPEEHVNQAAAFLLLAVARVYDPHVRQVLVDVESRRISTAEFVTGGGSDHTFYVVRADEQAPTVPALAEPIADSGSGDGSTAASA